VHKLIGENTIGDYVISSSGIGIPVTQVKDAQGKVTNMEHLAYVSTKTTDGTVSLLIVNRVEDDITISISIASSVKVSSQVTLAGGKYVSPSMTMSTKTSLDLSSVTIPAASVTILHLYTNASSTVSIASTSTVASVSTTSSSTTATTRSATTGNIVPTYEGCFEDPDNNRTINQHMTIFNDMTPAICLQHCGGFNLPVAAIYKATTCFCGAKNTLQQTPSDCWQHCPGDNQYICGGGDWRVSVYHAASVVYEGTGYGYVRVNQK